MSRTKGGKHAKPTVGGKARETVEMMDENDPVILMFRSYALALDEKHDRYERIVKLSRDITVESKRIIFLLHSSNTDIESKREVIIEQAEKRLKDLVTTNFKTIADELKNQDSYLYHRAYTAGLQEFIEAYAFCQYIKNESVPDWNFLNQLFQFSNDNNEEYFLHFPQTDLILGLGDFTGELMRKSINSLGVGNTQECFKLCNFVRIIHAGIIGLYTPGIREIPRKAQVLRQSLSKMELVCYNIQIRGSEIPKHMLVSVIESSNLDDGEDEGFY